MNTLAPLFRHSVGFDRFDELLDTALRSDQASGFPPYDIIRKGEDTYQVIMAVAGFARDELSITVQENVLRVSGKPSAAAHDGRTWLHRGIARRAFDRTFRLADHVEVEAADLQDGLLVIGLSRVVPEAKKPRRVPIGETHSLAEEQSA